jgi:hypothetical protein
MMQPVDGVFCATKQARDLRRGVAADMTEDDNLPGGRSKLGKRRLNDRAEPLALLLFGFGGHGDSLTCTLPA